MPSLVINTPFECGEAAFSPDGKSVAMVWGKGARIIPLDLSAREADPGRLLMEAEREAGMKLDGLSLVPKD